MTTINNIENFTKNFVGKINQKKYNNHKKGTLLVVSGYTKEIKKDELYEHKLDISPGIFDNDIYDTIDFNRFHNINLLPEEKKKEL